MLILSAIVTLVPETPYDSFEFVEGNKESENTIAIINLNGPIINSSRNNFSYAIQGYIEPQSVARKLENLSKKNIKTILIRINSPGGTVSATLELANIIKKYKKNMNYKIYFYTEEVLASGGYWVAVNGNKIYAKRGSIIGSIGVSGPNWYFYNQPTSIFNGLVGQSIETKNGVEVYSQNAGNSKDLYNPFRKPKIEELDHLKSMVEEIYDEFVIEVSKNRRIEIKNLKNNIGALVYTSNQAKKNFLIDEVINYNELIKTITKEQNFSTYKIIEDKFKSTIFDKIFFSNFKQELDMCKKFNNTLLTLLPTYFNNC